MGYILGKTSLKRAELVHPRMIAISERALSYGVLDFAVLKEGGGRTPDLQQILYDRGVSKTLDSKHLIKPDGFGRAIDLAPLPIAWKGDKAIIAFTLMATLMFRAASELGEQIEWGGFYRSWKDYPHFNLKGEI